MTWREKEEPGESQQADWTQFHIIKLQILMLQFPFYVKNGFALLHAP